MNKIIERKKELNKEILLLSEQVNLSFINYNRSKKNYDKLSKLLYENPSSEEIKNKFRTARKTKETDQKKYYQSLHKLDLLYKRNRQIVFAVISDNQYIKYSFLTDELFIEKELNDSILLKEAESNKEYILETVLNNNLNSIEEIKNYFSNHKRLIK